MFNLTNKINLTPSCEKLVATTCALGGAAALTTSILAAKSVITIGVASQIFPIIGLIMGIALMALGCYLLYEAWQNSPVTLPTTNEPTNEKKTIELLSPPARLPPLQKEELPEQTTLEPDPLALTGTDAIVTATNLCRGVAAYAAPKLLLPIGVGAEVAHYLSLPKDAHWLRKTLSLPGLPFLLSYCHPGIPLLFQLGSLYHLASHTAPKVWTAWKKCTETPGKAALAGAVHAFNLISSGALTAKSAWDQWSQLTPEPPELPEPPEPCVNPEEMMSLKELATKYPQCHRTVVARASSPLGPDMRAHFFFCNQENVFPPTPGIKVIRGISLNTQGPDTLCGPNTQLCFQCKGGEELSLKTLNRIHMDQALEDASLPKETKEQIFNALQSKADQLSEYRFATKVYEYIDQATRAATTS